MPDEEIRVGNTFETQDVFSVVFISGNGASRGSHACLFVRGVGFFSLFSCHFVFLIKSVHSRCRRPDFLCNSIVRFSVEKKKNRFAEGSERSCTRSLHTNTLTRRQVGFYLISFYVSFFMRCQLTIEMGNENLRAQI